MLRSEEAALETGVVWPELPPITQRPYLHHVGCLGSLAVYTVSKQQLHLLEAQQSPEHFLHGHLPWQDSTFAIRLGGAQAQLAEAACEGPLRSLHRGT